MSQPPQLARSEAEHLRALVRESSERTASSSFVIEGPHLLERALESAPADIRSAYFTHEALESFSKLRMQLEKQKIEIVVISIKQSERIADTKTPQGVFAVVSVASQRNKREDQCVIILDGVQDPGNVGTIIRAAAWFGVRRLIVGNNSADPYAPKTLRSTQGEIFSVTCETSADLVSTVAAMKKDGYQILTTTLDSAACSIYREEFSSKIVIVFGSESKGVSRELGRLADRALIIPRIGSGESLNVAMSAAIILAERARKMNFVS
ncbi:MAG TPA: RNA methyltransferase [Candidatus Kapabacteria bacterium]|nr:RNA methyltransferase [Candidatus Kapabacteria bacterium]